MPDPRTPGTAPRIVAVIPCYNHGATIAAVIDATRQHLPDIIVVDDGSDTAPAPEGLPGVERIALSRNRGKGAALRAAFARALERGFTHAITLDADGQHLADDLPLFIEAVAATPGALVIGNRILAAGGSEQPARSRFGRAFGAFWYRFHTGRRIDDTQCGFRAYPLAAVAGLKCPGSRYEYEIEALVRAAWNGMEVRQIPIHLRYFPKEQRSSRFRPIVDFLRISRVNSVFSLIRILTPWRTIAVPGRRGVDKILYLARQELTANATPGRAAWSLALGVFLAIFPIHGFQVMTALALGYGLRLNRALVLIGVSVSSAPLLPLIIAAAIVVGRWILPDAWMPEHSSTAATALSYGMEFVAGSVVLSLISGAVTLVTAYAVFRNLRGRSPK